MSALALLSTNDHDISVNTEAAKQTLADQLDSLSVVTSYAHAIGNAYINPVSSPPEPWFLTLNENLHVAKTHALDWIGNVGPLIGSRVPQSIINFNNVFMNATQELLTIIGNKESLTTDEKEDVIDIIEYVLGTLQNQKTRVDDVKKQVDKFANDFEADHKNLTTGQNSAAEAVRLAKEDQQRIENKIVELQAELAQARDRVTTSGIALGAGIFLAVAAFALAVATGGTGLIVAGAVGIVAVGTAATFTGIYTAKIGKLMDEIVEQQRALENKKKQVAAVAGLLNTVTTLRTHNQAAKAALTDVSKMWHTLGEKLESVLKELKEAKTEEIPLLQQVNIATARTNWQDTAAFALKFQHVASGTKVQPPLQHATLLKAF
jgi:hypothetical protein